MQNNFKSTLKSEDIPFMLPGNWVWYKWGDLIVDYQQGLIRSNRELNSFGIPYLKMNNLDNDGNYSLNNIDHAEATEEEIRKFIFDENMTTE